MCGIRMRLFKQRKGIIFSLLAILLSTMFVLILTGGLGSRLDTSIEFSRSRADTVNAYYESFKDYSRFVFEMSAKACLDAVSQDMITNGNFYPDEQGFFDDVAYCMLTGNATFPFPEHTVMTEEFLVDNIFQTLTNLTEEEYKIRTNYNITDLDVTYYTDGGNIYPDEFKVIAKTNIELYDDYTHLSPGEFQTIVNIKLNGMYDPYYSINTTELNRIEDIIIIGKNDDHLRGLTFSEFLDEVNYIQYSKGVSILDRIVGNFDDSQVGLIFFLNRTRDYETSSYVDIHLMNDTYFPANELFCEKSGGICVDEFFRIDAITLAVMETRYDLDVSDWDRIG